MVSHRELSMTTKGILGHAALALWMQESLSQMFDTVLHEPLPQALLVILDSKTEANAASIRVQDEPGHARF